MIIKNKNINDVHFYIRSATAASHYYGNLRTGVQRLQTDFILIHVWGLKFLNLISFHSKTLPCPQNTNEGLKCLAGIHLSVDIYILTTITELTSFASSLHSHLRIKKCIISQLKCRIYSCHKSISKCALQTLGVMM